MQFCFVSPQSVGLCFRKRCFFVDLFVRVSNQVAVDIYRKLGYTIYRVVLEYYAGEKDEDAYGEVLSLEDQVMLHKTCRFTILFLTRFTL